MRIKKLEIRNALGVKELSLEPGKVTMIKGGSEKGKSSILEAIEKVLYNSSRRTKFVRTGENEAYIYTEIEPDISITRKIRGEKSDAVKVLKDGSVQTSPEAFLKNLVNNYAFNPVAFLNLTDKQQTDMLLGLIPLNISEDQLTEWLGELPPINLSAHGLTVLKAAEKHFYDLRTETNRDLKTTQTQLDALSLQLPVNYDPATWEKISLKEKYDEIHEVEQENRDIEKAKETVEKVEAFILTARDFTATQIEKADAELVKRIYAHEQASLSLKDGLVSEMQKLKTRIAEIETELSGQDEKKAIQISNAKESIQTLKDQHAKDGEKEVKALEEKREEANILLKTVRKIPALNVDRLKATAEHIEEMKGYIPIQKNVQSVQERLKYLQENSVYLDGKIEFCRNKPAELLSQMEMPVSGLGINDEFKITIDDLPIDNLSSSRQIQLSLEIARATSGKLKLICVDQFETLDTDRRAEFLKSIADDKYQYFITQVTNGPLEIKTS